MLLILLTRLVQYQAVSCFTHVNITCTYKNMHLLAVLVDYTHANDVPTMQYYLLHYLTIFSFDFNPSSTYFHHFASTTKDWKCDGGVNIGLQPYRKSAYDVVCSYASNGTNLYVWGAREVVELVIAVQLVSMCISAKSEASHCHSTWILHNYEIRANVRSQKSGLTTSWNNRMCTEQVLKSRRPDKSNELKFKYFR